MPSQHTSTKNVDFPKDSKIGCVYEVEKDSGKAISSPSKSLDPDSIISEPRLLNEFGQIKNNKNYLFTDYNRTMARLLQDRSLSATERAQMRQLYSVFSNKKRNFSPNDLYAFHTQVLKAYDARHTASPSSQHHL